jgi:hypothetical protein
MGKSVQRNGSNGWRSNRTPPFTFAQTSKRMPPTNEPGWIGYKVALSVRIPSARAVSLSFWHSPKK